MDEVSWNLEKREGRTSRFKEESSWELLDVSEKAEDELKGLSWKYSDWRDDDVR